MVASMMVGRFSYDHAIVARNQPVATAAFALIPF